MIVLVISTDQFFSLIMAKRHLSLKDLAAELNISISTVSRALKNHPDISPELTKKVQELAMIRNYTPNPLAMGLLKQETRMIGVIVPDLVTIYEGFVTVIKLKMPIEITCEDNMYLLKQVLVPPDLRLFSAETSIEEIATKLVDYVNLQKGTSLTVHDAPAGVRTYAGAYRVVGNVTVAQVLDDFRSHMKINSWFRGDALHCSAIAYFPDEANPVNPIFVFQQNIIDDSLNYTRLDDVRLGATVYTVQQEEQTTTNKNGHKKTKMKRLETTVGDKEGEQRTIIVYSKPGEVTTVEQLKAQGEAQLKRFKYEGFVGEFTTFGEPVVNHGDMIELWDNILPERNGVYFVSSVARSTGVNGYRQKIKLDIKVSGVNDINITPEQIAKGV